jgi:phosphatidylinositol dimannoside acyltransferase
MQYLTYLAYTLAWRIVRFLPERTAYSLADRVADYFYNKNGRAIQRLRGNYKKITQIANDHELEKLTKDGMRSYLRYWCDTFRFPGWDKERILATTKTDNENFLRDPVVQGRGVIVALPHAGNWDHAGAYFCSTGIPLTTVAEHLKPEKLFQKFLSYREAMGFEVLDLNSRSIATLSQRLRQGKLVALVADRDLTSSGIEINLAGDIAKFPAGPALLSIKTGAPLITAYVKYEGNGIRIIFEGEIAIPESGSDGEKVAAMTQVIADRFCKQIKAAPTDWHMLQRIWIDS